MPTLSQHPSTKAFCLVHYCWYWGHLHSITFHSPNTKPMITTFLRLSWGFKEHSSTVLFPLRPSIPIQKLKNNFGTCIGWYFQDFDVYTSKHSSSQSTDEFQMFSQIIQLAAGSPSSSMEIVQLQVRKVGCCSLHHELPCLHLEAL